MPHSSSSISDISETETQSIPQTFWERANCSRWGEYLGSVEREAILTAHDLFEQPGHAIEYGCGGGRWARMLAELGWNMTCIDIQEESLAVCRERIPDASCILTSESCSNIPCDTNSAELLLLIEVPVMQHDWFLREASRVLIDGGRLVIVVWNKFSWRGYINHHLARIKNDFDWYSKTYIGWSQQRRAEGFVSEYNKGFCWFPFGRFSNSGLIPLCTRIESMMGLKYLLNISPWIVEVLRKTP